MANADNVRPWAETALVGQPVDIAPWTYEWRADRKVQKTPEAYFIPRRLDRIDKVYRTAYNALPQDQLKSLYYDMTDLLKPLLPKPEGSLLTGLLWTGGLVDYRVELVWPRSVKNVPSPDAVEVRVYPTSFGWFGWTVDKILRDPQVSADGRTWTYKSDPTAKMDSSYSQHVPAATEMVAVFGADAKAGVPSIHVAGPSMGEWKRMDVEIEWGFEPGSEGEAFDGRLESYVAKVGPMAPLSGDAGTTVAGSAKWQSKRAGEGRRGITIPVLYAPNATPGLDSRVTVRSKSASFTFRVKDLEKGPVYVPQFGVFVTKAGDGQSAGRFVRELNAKGLKSVRQLTRNHREASSFDELMQEVRLWTCPEGTAYPRFPRVADPAMDVQISDERWTDAWRSATFQLRGEHMWGGLAFEVGRVAREMDMIGLHAEADKVYNHFLETQGVKPDGDYSDGDGALEWAASMRHDMGYSHDGTHSSTGRVLFAMAERYFLTGDREWFQQRRARLQAAADWIIRQRRDYLKEAPNRGDLFVASLMPPQMLGDYAIPSCDWHWYYVDNALSLQAIQRFADALADFDPAAAKKYHAEADAFRKDLRRVIDREAILSPVRIGHDGTYRTFIPRMAYSRGLTGVEIGAPQFPDTDMFTGALPLAEPFSALAPNDPRMMDTLDAMEEMGTSPAAVRDAEKARAAKGLPDRDAWFWNPFARLPKASHNANVYLLQDDVPNFLRFWGNEYAAMVGADGKLWEHWHLGGYTNCESPDNGTAGWIMECFRNLLVMEDGQSLWIARATPRAWLAQGKKIAVKNAPTYFGDLAYEIVSDVQNGRITATVDLPTRTPAKSVIVRLRHPDSAPIKSVTVNGKSWRRFDPKAETITLSGLTGRAVVVAAY